MVLHSEGDALELRRGSHEETVMSAPFRSGRLAGEGTHPDLGIIDDGKVAFPVVPRANRLPNRLCDSRGRNEREPEEDNSRRGGKTVMKSKRAEICVEGEHHTVFLLGTIQEDLVRCSRVGRLCPGHVVSVVSKPLHDIAGHILVDEEPHQDVEEVLAG